MTFNSPDLLYVPGPTGADGPAGPATGLQFIQKLPAAGLQTVDVPLPVAYSKFLFLYEDLVPGGYTDPLQVRFGTGSPVSWKSDATYHFAVHYFNSAGNGPGLDANEEAVAAINVSEHFPAAGSFTGELWLLNAKSAAQAKKVSFETRNYTGTTLLRADGVGAYLGSTDPVTGVRFLMPNVSGFVSGTVALYGAVDS